MSLLREYIRSLLMEVPLDDFEYVTQSDDDVMVREEVADYFKAIPQSVNIYVAHTDDLSWAHRLPNEIQGKVSGFKSRGQTGLTDIANIGKIYPQIQKAMNPEGINLLYIYPKSYEVPAGGDSFIADVNPHYLAHDLHHMLENVPGRERGEKDKFTSLIKEYLMELVWLSHGGGSMEAEQVRNTMRLTGRRLGVANTNLLMSELFPGIKLPSGDFDLFGDVFADYLKNDGNLVLGVPEQLDYKGTVIELNPDSKHDQRAQQYEKKFKDLFDTVLDPLKGKVALFNIFEVEHRDVERARKQAEEKIQADHGPILDHIKSMGGEFLSFSESYKEEGSFVLVFRLDLKPDPPLLKAEEFIQQFPKEAESIEALGYEIVNAAGGMWAPTVEIRLKKAATNESMIRSYIREGLLLEKEKQKDSLFSGIGDFIESHHYDDVMDSVFKRIAPNMVRHVLEREINEDMAEFKDGAIEGRFERRADWAAEDPSPEEFGSPKDSVDYKLGYTWGWLNADTWEGNELPAHARKQAVEMQVTEFEDQISEQMVIAALEAANDKVNPVKLLGKAKDAIYSAVQEDGWVGGLKKGLPIAVGIIVGEALDNFIIPMAVYSLTGLPIPPLPVGVGEIINPIVFSMVGADVGSEEIADELGWYESSYGTIEALGPKPVKESVIQEVKVLGYKKPAECFKTLSEWESFVTRMIELQDDGLDTRSGEISCKHPTFCSQEDYQEFVSLIVDHFGFQMAVEVERYDLLTLKNVLDFIEDFVNHRFWGLEREFGSYFPDISKLRIAYFYSRGDIEPYILIDDELTTQLYGSTQNPKMLMHYTNDRGVERIRSSIETGNDFDISSFTVAERDFFRDTSDKIMIFVGNVRAGFRSDIKSFATTSGRRAVNLYRLEYPGRDVNNICYELESCDGDVRTSLWNEYIATPLEIIDVIDKDFSDAGEILIPPPPEDEMRLLELPVISNQYHNRFNDESLQAVLDGDIVKVFDTYLMSIGIESMSHLMKKLKESVEPVIHFHKEHFNSERPNELADRFGVPFKFDHLDSAQTPSYPSGHTTQAFYIAMKISQMFPELKGDLFSIANMVAESRVDRGVHFPSDNAAGKLLASKLAGAIS